MILMPDEAITEVELESAEAPAGSKRSVQQRGFGRLLRILGPGIVTGAADDDPSGIATYSQAGAQFGLAMPWTMVFTYPLMMAVQEACMRVGAVTGKGLAAVIREHYPRYVLFPLVLLVVLANTLNIGADLGAMAAAAQLLLPSIPFGLLAVVFAAVIIILEVFLSYRTYVCVLKWLALSLLAYLVTAILVNVPWAEAVKATFVPSVRWSPDYLYIFVGILGTTVSPYLFFWQTSEVVEEEVAAHRLAQRGGAPRVSWQYLKQLRVDTALGMLFASVTGWFIIIVAAVVLHGSGVTNIESAADAAKALEPLVQGLPYAGVISKLVFAVGIVGIGLLAVPVLAGSSSYAISETFKWREGLFRKYRQARQFYIVIILGTGAGLALNFLGLHPIKALIFAAVFNGLAAVPLIFVIARIVNRRDVMGEYRGGIWSLTGLWTAFGVMLLAAGAMFYSLM